MRVYVYAILSLTVAWFLLRGSLAITALFEGLFFATLALLITRGIFRAAIRRPFPKVLWRLPWFLRYLAFVVKRAVVGSFDVAYRAFHPKLPVYPAIIAVDIAGLSELEVAIMANTINLSPGTLTMEIDMDRGRMFVHTINGTHLEDVRAEIREVGEYVEDFM